MMDLVYIWYDRYHAYYLEVKVRDLVYVKDLP